MLGMPACQTECTSPYANKSRIQEHTCLLPQTKRWEVDSRRLACAANSKGPETLSQIQIAGKPAPTLKVVLSSSCMVLHSHTLTYVQ